MNDIIEHGDVSSFCKAHGLEVTGSYTGSLSEYVGERGTVLVSDADCGLFEFYRQKYRLIQMGVTLISARERGAAALILDEFVTYLTLGAQGKGRVGGRQPFGFRWVVDHRESIPEDVERARRVIALRESGLSLRQIEQETGLNVSTVQSVLRNKELYMNDD